MDPAKRLCIKNLPPDVTKKDIADLIRKRTKAQPQYIDLGVDEEGVTRRYAHVTVEGLKSVVEAINGVAIRGFNVIVEQAKPHYSFALAEARRKREREERDEEDALKAKTEHLVERWSAQPITISKDKPPKSFFYNKQRYAQVASQIAKQGRDKHKQQCGHSNMAPSTRIVPGEEGGEVIQDASGAHDARSLKRARHEKLRDKRRQKKPEEPAAPPPPPEPPQPTKEEKKLSGLQAKLAALREKMKAK